MLLSYWICLHRSFFQPVCSFLSFYNQRFLVIVGVVLIISLPFFVYTYNILTHRYMIKYISTHKSSGLHYEQQKKLTILLVGQGSLPLIMPLLAGLIIAPSIPDMLMNGRPPSKFVWQLSISTITVYPLISAILTIVLTKPYYVALKSMLKIRIPAKQRKVSVIAVTF